MSDPRKRPFLTTTPGTDSENLDELQGTSESEGPGRSDSPTDEKTVSRDIPKTGEHGVGQTDSTVHAEIYGGWDGDNPDGLPPVDIPQPLSFELPPPLMAFATDPEAFMAEAEAKQQATVTKMVAKWVTRITIASAVLLTLNDLFTAWLVHFFK